MASTPTLPKGSGWTLRAIHRAGQQESGLGSGAVSVLYPADHAPEWVEICEEGFVVEGESYEFEFEGPRSADLQDAALVMGDGEYDLRLCRTRLVEHPGCEDTMAWGFVMENGATSPFAYAYALVRCTFILDRGDGGQECLTSLDIPCLSMNPRRGRDAQEMLLDLTSADKALDWMFGGPSEAGGVWGVADMEPRLPGPTDARLLAASSALDTFESSLGALRTQAATRVDWEGKMTPANKVRRCGRAEADWLARNPSALREDVGGAVRAHDGRTYTPGQLMVQTPVRSANTYENGVLLGFLAQTAQNVRALAFDLKQKASTAETLVDRLSAVGALGAELPALAAAQLGGSFLKSLADRAEAVARRAARLHLMYTEALPGAQDANLAARLPKRTKVFRERPLYARLWHAMERASQARFDSLVVREGFALQAMRLNSLFELFVLHRMLSWLGSAGFVPSSRFGEPIEAAHYSVGDKWYRDQENVAGVYRLDRGAERVTLWYQPVLHGDEREEMGVTCHRTTVLRDRWGQPRDTVSHYTPDYLLVYETRHVRRCIVLDAKFANLPSLVRPKDEKATVEDAQKLKGSIFQETAVKYLLEVADSVTGKPADAVWLLCADTGFEFWRFQTSPWVAARPGFIHSGIAQVSPNGELLDELFAELGIEAPWGIRARRTREAVPMQDEAVLAVPATAATEESELAEGETAPDSDAESPSVREPESQAEFDDPAGSALGSVAGFADEPVDEPAQKDEADDEAVSAEARRAVGKAAYERRIKAAAGSKPRAVVAPAKSKAKAKAASPAKEQGPSAVPAGNAARPASMPKAGDADEVASLIERILSVYPDSSWLRKQRDCQKAFGINAAVVKDKPGPKDKGRYAAREVGGSTLYVYARPNPVQITVMRNYVESLEAKKA